MKLKKWKYGGVLFVAVVIATIFLWKYFPYEDPATKHIINVLKNLGINVSSLKVEKITSNKAIISDIKIDDRFSIGSLNLKYNLSQVFKGKTKTINLENINTTIYNKEGWKIAGFEEVLNNTNQAEQKNINTEKLRKILPDNLDINNLNINIDAKPYKIFLKNINIKAGFDGDKKWGGKINIPEIVIFGTPEELPNLKAEINYLLEGEDIKINAEIFDNSKKYQTKFEINYPINDKDKAIINIEKFEFPWGNGKISTDKFSALLNFNKPISANIIVKNVELSELLGKASGGEIKGEGRVSGKIPITYYPDGKISLDKGEIKANDTGTISVAPSLIPGSGEQLDLTRKLLQNFRYTKLKISVSSDKIGKSVLNLALEGKNPEVAEDRPVKLNVNLSGDIISLIRQSVLPFNDPQQLIEDSK